MPAVGRSRVTYSFRAHFHPCVDELMQELIAHSIARLQEADTADPPPGRELFTESEYRPTTMVREEPDGGLDFDNEGAYSVYNWELFFHAPITIAIHLSRNGRFEEAQRWFHFVFDPTDDSDGPTPERFWKTAPLRTTTVASLEEVLASLSEEADPTLRRHTEDSIAAWAKSPFRPHLVAGYRPSAYMVHTVMAYLDNLISWGDALFNQDTTETVAEATQLYVLAAHLLGPRPQQIPATRTVLAPTYNSLQARLTAGGGQENALSLGDLSAAGPVDSSEGTRQLDTLGLASFCIPRNEKLLGYWDTVADRLFKLRNSLNLAGVFRQLPLFDPPIDPAMLARATAAGVDVAAVVAGVNQPAPLVRFAVLAAKAGELCQEVKGLGAALLAAIEKHDGEALAALRARHESATWQLGETVRYAQWQEAIKNREALEMSRDLVCARYTYFQRLLGVDEDDITFTDAEPLDAVGLESGRFSATEPTVSSGDVNVDIDPSSLPDGGGPAEGKKISTHESQELRQLDEAQIMQNVAAGLETLGGLISLVPLTAVDAKPFGVGAGLAVGGLNLAGAISGLAAAARGVAGQWVHEAGKAARIGGYARREQEWQFQRNAAAGEINQIVKQLRAAEIREFLAHRELENHRHQHQQAQEVEQFLAGERPGGKTTTTAYYALMRREVRGVYNRAYELALDTAQKAERALRTELGDRSLSFVQPSYLAGPEGLLAGDKLHLDIRRMELAHLDQNRREYELVKHVSLLQIAPVELVRLRATGRATLTIPEELFDLDTPGHYFRRIRSVAISIPCITGPYTGVSCTARLVRSRVRTSSLLKDGGYVGVADDDRFDDQLGATEAIVTSGGSNDSGLFEANLRDERLLPFEYRGVTGEWQLELADDPRPFDYDTITDVVLHLRYTARDGGAPLRDAAAAHLRALLDDGSTVLTSRLLSVRHEFPSAWVRFQDRPPGSGTAENPRAAVELDLRREHYPFLAGPTPAALSRITLFARPAEATTTSVVVADRAVGGADEGVRTVELTGRADLGDVLVGTVSTGAADGATDWGTLPDPVGPLSLHVADAPLEDLLVLLTWRGRGA